MPPQNQPPVSKSHPAGSAADASKPKGEAGVDEVKEEDEQLSPNYYKAMLEDFQASGALFWKPKVGKSKIRILPDTKDKRRFFVPVQRSWEGKAKTRYLIRVILFRDDEEPQFKAMISPKTLVNNMLNLLSEGYNLLGQNGHGLTVTRSGQRLDTTYLVTPSQKPQPLPEDMDIPETDLDELTQQLYEQDVKWAAQRGSNGQTSPEDIDEDEDAPEAPTRLRRGASSQGSWD